MKWKILIIPFLFFYSFQVSATHIVGGEIELVHDSAYNYHINLILYFDSVNGNPQAEDPFARVGLFRKFDNLFVDSLLLPKINSTLVPYSFPDCSVAELVTMRILYSAPIELRPEIYNDFGGYYISWDRCCRNDIITNLLTPGAQGQLFYLEFPPVNLNGNQIINSSPVLFPPVSDYACRDELFYFDFSGTDPDGDSLAYSLTDPLRGFSSVNAPSFPIPFAGPYPEIIWQTGYSSINMIPGTPPLEISGNGFLTVKPSINGLFVFAVKCEEYRNGVKIGEIRRDFQIIVRDCPNNEPPTVSVQNPVDSSNYFSDDTLYFDLSNRCFNIFLKDPDPNTDFNVEINALNFDPSTISVSPEQGLLPNGDSLRARICFNKCAASDSAAYLFEVILSDDGCSLPKKDTFLITAIVEAIPNLAPAINSNFIGDSIILEVGDTVFMNINGIDSDNDTIILDLGNNSFNPSEYDMIFSRVVGEGQVTSLFYWVPTCKALDLNGRELVFETSDFICSDFKSELRYPLKIISNNKKPLLSSNLPNGEVIIDLRNDVNINLQASDTNRNDILLIKLNVFDSSGILLQNLGYSLGPTSSREILNSVFSWKPECELLNIGDLDLQFIVSDNGCSGLSDTLDLAAKINYQNTKPSLSLLNIEKSGKQKLDLLLFTDSTIGINFTGFDIDDDLLKMTLIESEEVSTLGLPIIFSSEDGIGTSAGTLVIGPGSCVGDDSFNSNLLLILEEESCTNLADTFELNLTLEEFFKEINMPNVFTPNGDGKNDFFQPIQLPKRCEFADVVVYNRWGQEVYRNENSDFKWDGSNLPAGDYFYILKFKEENYKGIVKILK
jgi:gliding motility-associated-like protein